MKEESQLNNKRIAKNSLYLYIRMVFLMFIGFYTTRVVLQTLGVEDLGIYNIVGSFIVMFDFVTSGLTNSTQRYLNIGLGKGDVELTRQYFSQSLVVHIVFAICLMLFAETFGLWFLYNKMVIPEERFTAALYVYHFSVISLFLRFIKLCYESNVVAREKMTMYAYLSIIEGIGKLLICFFIIKLKSIDKLVLYALLMLLLNLSITAWNVCYCLIKFPESKLKICTDKKLYKSLVSFIGINSIGVMSWALGKQGINVVLNMFFGPAVNGAKGLATTIDSVVSKFGTNIDIAVRPQITKLYASGNIDAMLSLAEKSTKYIIYLLLLISMPVYFYTYSILQLWLGEVPEYTVIFVQLLLVENIVNALGSMYNTICMSVGKIVNTQVYGRLITLSALPISYFLLKLYNSPIIPVIIMVICTFLYSLYIVHDVGKKIHVSFSRFFKNTFSPICFVAIILYLVGLTTKNLIEINHRLINLLANSIIMVAIATVIIFLVGVEKSDKIKIMALIKSKFIGLLKK